MAHDAPATALGPLQQVAGDFGADKQAFTVPWGKAMMWIFLLSDTFIFSCFLTSYMNDGSGEKRTMTIKFTKQ